MDQEVAKIYGNRVRARVCGLCWSQDSLLMVNHSGLTDTDFWAPPGGGIEFGQPATDCLSREFQEETGLNVMVKNFLFAVEFIHHPLHAIELFYEVEVKSGALKIGNDPELQIIRNVRYMNLDEIKSFSATEVHGIFKLVRSPSELKALRGFFSI